MSTDNKINITLTDARPMRVSKTAWPLVARASEDRDHNNQELFRRYYLRVRLHAVRTPDGQDALEYHGADKSDIGLAPHPDGRAIVYGWYESSWQGESGISGGYCCTLDEAADYVRKVGQEIGAEESLIVDCIGDLPPVDGEDEPNDILEAFTDEQLTAELERRKHSAA